MCIRDSNRGRDANEGFEIEVRGTPDAVNRLTVFLYNGLNGSVYKTVPGRELEVGLCYPEANVTVLFCYTALQNGGRDGIALVTHADGEPPHTHEFLSWEGVCVAQSGPCKGQRSVDIGAREGGATAASQSLQRTSSDMWVVRDASMGRRLERIDDTPASEN